MALQKQDLANGISIHALLAESDPQPGRAGLPANHFYPRSPCGERRQVRYFLHMDNPISIHALLAESDCCPRKHG